MKTPRKKCTFSYLFPFSSTSFHIFSCQSNLTLSNARASRSCLIQVVFSSERLCGWGGGHICSAEASVGTYRRRVVTSQCNKEQRFRVCQSVTGFVDFHWRVLDRYPCYVNHIDIAVHLVCLQGRCTISTSPNRFEVSQRWRQGDRMSYLYDIYIYTNIFLLIWKAIIAMLDIRPFLSSSPFPARLSWSCLSLASYFAVGAGKGYRCARKDDG